MFSWCLAWYLTRPVRRPTHPRSILTRDINDCVDSYLWTGEDSLIDVCTQCRRYIVIKIDPYNHRWCCEDCYLSKCEGASGAG